MKKFILLFCVLFFAREIHAQKLNQEYLDELSAEYAKKSFSLLKDLLSIPNDALYPDDIQKNIVWCEKAFQKRNFTTLRLETETAPLLLAERKVKNAKKNGAYLSSSGWPARRYFKMVSEKSL